MITCAVVRCAPSVRGGSRDTTPRALRCVLQGIDPATPPGGSPRPCWRPHREGDIVKIAVIGGTGSFGMAVATRLVAAGYDVIIGSRDAERAKTTAAEVGAADGATNADAARAADLVVLATNADATLDTARDLADAIGTTPGALRRRRAQLRQGRRPADRGGDLDRPAHPGRRRRPRSSPACTRSPPPTSAATRHRRRTRSSAATTPRRRRSCSRSPAG